MSPAYPALAGGFFTSAPPEKPLWAPVVPEYILQTVARHWRIPCGDMESLALKKQRQNLEASLWRLGKHVKSWIELDFPGSPVAKNLPANAGDIGSIPGLERFRMPQATKPVHHSYWSHAPIACTLQQEKPPQWEAHAMQQRVAPLTTIRVSPHAATKTQHSLYIYLKSWTVFWQMCPLLCPGTNHSAFVICEFIFPPVYPSSPK